MRGGPGLAGCLLFRAEARHAGSFSYPGIVRIYDYGEKGPRHRPYLVMELVIGRSLARVLAFGPVEPARAMDVVAQTAAGLHAAHSAGLVHCDIKPANLLLGWRPGEDHRLRFRPRRRPSDGRWRQNS